MEDGAYPPWALSRNVHTWEERPLPPKIQPWEIPAKYTQNFVDIRTKEVERAIQHVCEALGYDLCEETNVSPREYAMGGFQWGKTQKNLTRLVKARRAQIMRGGMTEDGRIWLDAASTDGSPGASGWVTAIPTSPETTMTNVDFALCFKARFRLTQVTLGYPVHLRQKL